MQRKNPPGVPPPGRRRDHSATAVTRLGQKLLGRWRSLHKPDIRRVCTQQVLTACCEEACGVAEKRAQGPRTRRGRHLRNTRASAIPCGESSTSLQPVEECVQPPASHIEPCFPRPDAKEAFALAGGRPISVSLCANRSVPTAGDGRLHAAPPAPGRTARLRPCPAGHARRQCGAGLLGLRRRYPAERRVHQRHGARHHCDRVRMGGQSCRQRHPLAVPQAQLGRAPRAVHYAAAVCGAAALVRPSHPPLNNSSAALTGMLMSGWLHSKECPSY